HGIHFGYRNSNLLYRDFSLTFPKGITGLIGRNGAGKSTLVKLILGLHRLKSGSITYDGLDVKSKRDTFLKHVGVMFEQQDFPGWLTIFDHLVSIGQLRGLSVSDARREAEGYLERFGLGDKMEVRFQKLSAGMKQKFGIAAALIGDPDLVILDEPTANLDVSARSEILTYIRRITSDTSRSVILLSHILHDLERICDNLVIIEKGVLKAEFPVTELADRTFVKTYTVRTRSSEESTEVASALKERGLTVEIRGVNLEVTIRTKDDLGIFEEMKLHSTPLRSLLEQYFMDVTQ
ncbi:MAG: ABC transporter ATP-binding protein, partial [Gammaproteobacteria bacterium]